MIEFRTAAYADYLPIARLHALNWQTTYRGIFTDKFLDEEVVDERADVWKKRFTDVAINQHVLLAMSDQDIAGFACIYYNDDPMYGTLLDNLHVSDKFRGTGLGKQLMRSCATSIIEHAENQKMYLWAFDLNKHACRVYEHLGAEKVQTMETENSDGSKAIIHRYFWKDASVLL